MGMARLANGETLGCHCTAWQSASTSLILLTSSPYINRFLQPDSIIPDLSNPQSCNRYSFISGNPLNFVDPSGHDGITPAGNVITVNIALGLNIGPIFLAYY
jgi:hypothetical protein